ncbi:MAG: flap endonuclease [Acidimicrobiia bacterium]|nr:flap endonuclease [Acidimicrobiia bacterium]
MQIHLVDGTYELFRQFFARPSHRTAAGVEVAATRAAVSGLLRLVADGATHVGVATDHVIPSFRNEMYPGYKSGDGVDVELLGQFPLLEEVAAAAGFTVWHMVDYEADDALATAAARAATDPAVERILICTPDKDLAQCVSDDGRVVQFDVRHGRLFDRAGVVGRFGVPPSSIPDYLALVGDSADGFSGLPGWGPKSAAALLGRYGHIEDIPDASGQWDVAVRGAVKLAATLAAGRQEADLYRRLATLVTDVPGVLDSAEPGAGAVDALAWVGPQPGFAELCERIDAARLAEVAASLAPPSVSSSAPSVCSPSPPSGPSSASRAGTGPREGSSHGMSKRPGS